MTGTCTIRSPLYRKFDLWASLYENIYLVRWISDHICMKYEYVDTIYWVVCTETFATNASIIENLFPVYLPLFSSNNLLTSDSNIYKKNIINSSYFRSISDVAPTKRYYFYQLENIYIFRKFHDEQWIIDNQIIQYNSLSLVINNSVSWIGTNFTKIW
jgi:hypothetical protein